LKRNDSTTATAPRPVVSQTKKLSVSDLRLFCSNYNLTVLNFVLISFMFL